MLLVNYKVVGSNVIGWVSSCLIVTLHCIVDVPPHSQLYYLPYCYYCKWVRILANFSDFVIIAKFWTCSLLELLRFECILLHKLYNFSYPGSAIGSRSCLVCNQPLVYVGKGTRVNVTTEKFFPSFFPLGT